MSWAVHLGDCIDVMRSLPAESVDAVITSPPYAEQRKATYGGVPESEYPAWTVAWMAEARRLLKPNGSAVINIRPHVRNGQISDYTLRTRLALREDGWAEIEELIWHKRNPMPVGSLRRPRRSWESLHWFAHHGRPFCDPIANGTPRARAATGLHYGQHAKNGWGHYQSDKSENPATVRCADYVSLGPMTTPTGHPAPYPVDLAAWVAKLICPPGGTVLDPFNGSASTGVAAVRNGLDYVGIDAAPEYVELSRRRLDGEAVQLSIGEIA